MIVITACASSCTISHRQPPATYGVTQVPGPRAELPSEYVFCDLAGGSWHCGEITPKTPVDDSRPTNRLRVPGSGSPAITTASSPDALETNAFRASLATIIPTQPETNTASAQVVDQTPKPTVADRSRSQLEESDRGGSLAQATFSSSDEFKRSIDSLLRDSDPDSSSDGESAAVRAESATPDAIPSEDRLIVVHFDRKSTRPDFSALSDAIDLLSGKDVEIQAHTDDHGGSEYNMMLSQLRAYETFDYLVNAGIPKERITVRAFGECCAAVPNTDAAARAQNRRVEIRAQSPPVGGAADS